MTGIEMTTEAKDDETWIVGVLVGGAVLAGATMIVVKLYELTERKGEPATVRPTAHDWDTWRMPPLARLPAAHLSRLSRIWMIVLRGYLVVAAGLVLLRIFQLATVGA
jgi:hypothetical protein